MLAGAEYVAIELPCEAASDRPEAVPRNVIHHERLVVSLFWNGPKPFECGVDVGVDPGPPEGLAGPSRVYLRIRSIHWRVAHDHAGETTSMHRRGHDGDEPAHRVANNNRRTFATNVAGDGHEFLGPAGHRITFAVVTIAVTGQVHGGDAISVRKLGHYMGPPVSVSPTAVDKDQARGTDLTPKEVVHVRVVHDHVAIFVADVQRTPEPGRGIFSRSKFHRSTLTNRGWPPPHLHDCCKSPTIPPMGQFTDYNPFADETLANPFPAYAEMRATCPMHRFDDYPHPLYTVTRYEDVAALLTNVDTWSSKYGQMPRFSVQGCLFDDPPNHTWYRRLVQKSFAPRHVAAMEDEISALVTALLDEMERDGRGDLHDALACPLPVLVIANILGVPTEDMDQFKAWSDEQLAAANASDAQASQAPREAMA